MSDFLFKEFPESTADEWLGKIKADLKGKSYDEIMIWNTIDGLQLKPDYFTYSDKSIAAEDNQADWLIFQTIEAGTETNKKALQMLECGVEGLRFKINQNTDIKALLKGIYPEMVGLRFSQSLTIKQQQELEAITAKKTTSIFIEDDAFVDASFFHNSGGTAIQELAFALWKGSTLFNNGVRNVHFTFGIGRSYFVEIAKLRVFRSLWATVLEAYGIKNLTTNIHAVTSSWEQSIYDPYVNLLRGTSQCMSAVLGGADSVEVIGFDQAFKKDNEFSERLSRNTQHLLKEESYFSKVANVAAGSYYIEAIENQLMEKAWALFQQLDEKGIYYEKYVVSELKKSANQKQRLTEETKLRYIGVNRFPKQDEMMKKEVEKKDRIRALSNLEIKRMEEEQ